MSTVEGVLALVLLRGLKRGGKSLRLWFARRAYAYTRLFQLAEAQHHWCEMFRVNDWYRHMWHTDSMVLIHRQVESISCHAPAFPLRRVAFYSAIQQRFLIRWRRLAPRLDERYTNYVPMPAPFPKRRSARLSMKRNKRKKLKCAK